ncbi:MAG TPA: DUF885 family protein [Pyrinomonadaceae bacterium]|nr:DUF885 family protein [Pyrinomonadaceae bacterium]
MLRRSRILVSLLIGVLASGVCLESVAPAQISQQANKNEGVRPAHKNVEVLNLEDLKGAESEMRPVIERYVVDRGSLARSYPVSISSERRTRFRQFYSDWLKLMQRLDFESMNQGGKVDYVLFKNHIEHELRQLDIQSKQLAEIEALVPFADTITELEEARRRMEPIDAAKSAAMLTALKTQIEERRRLAELGLRPENKTEAPANSTGENESEALRVKRTVANRAVGTINSLRNNLRNWHTFYSGYDPVFTWWTEEPYKALDQTLTAYASFLSERVVGIKQEGTVARAAGPRVGSGPGTGQAQSGSVAPIPSGQRASGTTARPGDSSDIIGDPIGREALLSELRSEMIPYTPEELIAIAEKEMAWCESEMKKASRDLGYGDDWLKALEHVKNQFVEPGKQPEVIRDLALEAIKFVEDRELVTVPELARNTWRMEMMTPERQLVSPFFLGGEVIQVSFPTNTMAHEQKMMSMRGNNIHFARATVHHELIPGHHLQGFMTARYKAYRGLFSTPFWGEGWALYWELLLWDLNFARSPENRIGMLFWRMHRCARIIFSLSFHLEKMTPQECVELLVKRVGHERDNATAEVRRSFEGSYGPLYQIAYLIGGLQLYSLHRDLVGQGKITNRSFHDWILKENRIPIEMVRAILTKQKLARDFKSTWRFYDLPGGN